jgi:hypothetical protein
MNSTLSPSQMLALIKLLHTVIWAFFVGCIAAIPLAGLRGRFRRAGWLSALVWAECLVVAVNHLRCPLTGLAARYTAERSPNFDIFLPAWLAEYNKLIFGALFFAGEVFVLVRWLRRRREALATPAC